jgi:hypothetical protein
LRPRERLRAFLVARYGNRPTELARDLNFGVKRAENLLNGHWPADDLTLAAIISRFGKDLWDAVFAPDVDQVLAQLKEQEARLEEELARTRERLRRAAGSGPGDPGASAEPAPARPAPATTQRRRARPH